MTLNQLQKECTGPEFVAGTIFGLRVFDVDFLGRIKSANQPHVWRPGWNTAVCHSPYGHHSPVPARNCGCGIYAFSGVRGRRRWTDKDARHTILGIIEASGRVLIGERGFRAEKARIVALWDGWTCHFGADVKAVKHNYPDIPFYTRKRAMLRAFPPYETQHYLTPDDEGFWEAL